jgi:hypothetical protein
MLNRKESAHMLLHLLLPASACVLVRVLRPACWCASACYS